MGALHALHRLANEQGRRRRKVVARIPYTGGPIVRIDLEPRCLTTGLHIIFIVLYKSVDACVVGLAVLETWAKDKRHHP